MIQIKQSNIMDFNWSAFEDSDKECNAQFNLMRQKIERIYQSKFDDNWLVGNWLQNYNNGKKPKEEEVELPIENPLLPLKVNNYLEFLNSANKTLGSIERAIQKPAEPQITAMDILEQLDFGPKMEIEEFDDALIRNRVFFDDNYLEYASEPTYDFTPSIVNMFLSLAAEKSPCNFAYSRVVSLEKPAESGLQAFESALETGAMQEVV